MSVRRASSLQITFAPVGVSARPARLSGTSFSGSEIQVSKDGAAFSNVAGAVTEIGSTGRYTVQLSAAEMDAAWVHIKIEKAGVVDPIDISLGTDGSASGSVVADGGNTSSTFVTDRTETTTDYWKNALLLITNSSSLRGQVTKVTGYNGTTKAVTVTPALTGTPTAGDRFIFVNM